MLQEVEIVASARNTMRSDRSGAVTNVNGEQMAAVPTVGRSMTDIMKLTPQSSSASGMAIGGGNYRDSPVVVSTLLPRVVLTSSRVAFTPTLPVLL